MPQLTELAWIPLKPDAKDSKASASLKQLGPDMRARPGLEGSWHGAPLERPQSAEFVNIWSSEEAYNASKTSPIQEQATTVMRSLIDTSDPSVQPYHNTVFLHKPAEPVVSAPVVQITNIFLPSHVDKAAFDAAWEGLLEHMRANLPDGFVGGAHGWGLEEINGAKVFVALSGWESVEKNVAGQAVVADKFGAIQRFSNVFEMHHTSFKRSGEE